MPKLRLKIDPDRITIDELMAIEEGNARVRSSRDLIARFIVDENGAFVEEKEARAIVGKLTLTQLMDVGKDLGTKIKELMEAMVPPDSASS